MHDIAEGDEIERVRAGSSWRRFREYPTAGCWVTMRFLGESAVTRLHCPWVGSITITPLI